MDVKLFPLRVNVDGKAVVLAHPWPMNLDDALTGLFGGIMLVAISFEKTVVITPITRN
ncbi:MAG: hypothetical protein ACREIQ_08495 [Nitrospiria bacterium]